MPRYLKFLFLLIISSCALFGAREMLLEDAWYFKKGEISLAEACDPAAEMADWQRVRVPHDYAIDKAFDMTIDSRPASQNRVKTAASGALPQFGVGWYRRTINLPESERGQSVFVRFDGAMSGAQVYLNGQLVCERPFGYATFEADLTKFFKFGQDNILSVRLENPENSSRWYTGFGLYRKVQLVLRSQVRVPFGGIFVTTPQVEKEKAVVNIQMELENISGEAKTAVLQILIISSDGQQVGEVKTEVSLESGLKTVEQQIELANPQLWGLESPSLYKALTKVNVGDETVEELSTRFGIRSIHYDYDKGFFLNGESVKIKGLGQHHDFGPLGTAFNASAARRILNMLKDVGANALRTVHNPPAPELLDMCDEMGILVMDEIFDEWEQKKCENGYNKLFKQWAAIDLRDWIRRDRNHPSVIMWSLGNELPEQDKEMGAKNAKFLHKIVKENDPTRPTTAAMNGVLDFVAPHVDLTGCNYKQAIYPELREKFKKPIYGSETAAMLSSRGIYSFPWDKSIGLLESQGQVSSYCDEMRDWPPNAEFEWKAQDEYEFVFGEFAWCLTDYIGEPNPFEYSTCARSSYWGLTDLGGIKKDRYYMYRAKWNTKSDTLHILPHWTWPEFEGKTLPVHVFTNYDDVELFVNGKSVGRQKKTPEPLINRYRAIFEDVPYEAGELKAVAYDKDGKARKEQIVKTAGAPAAIKLIPEAKRLSKDSRDVVFMEVQIVDKDGNLCPRAVNPVFFKMNGNGRLRAVCNGDATDQTPFSASYMRAFSGKLTVVVDSPSGKEGKLRLTAWGSKLKGASVDIEVQ